MYASMKNEQEEDKFNIFFYLFQQLQHLQFSFSLTQHWSPHLGHLVHGLSLLCFSFWYLPLMAGWPEEFATDTWELVLVALAALAIDGLKRQDLKLWFEPPQTEQLKKNLLLLFLGSVAALFLHFFGLPIFFNAIGESINGLSPRSHVHSSGIGLNITE